MLIHQASQHPRLDVVFDFYFLLDLSLRMFVQRCNFCRQEAVEAAKALLHIPQRAPSHLPHIFRGRSSMNCFEACVTTASLADLVIIAHAGGLAHPADAFLGRSGTVVSLVSPAGALWQYCQYLYSGIHECDCCELWHQTLAVDCMICCIREYRHSCHEKLLKSVASKCLALPYAWSAVEHFGLDRLARTVLHLIRAAASLRLIRFCHLLISRTQGRFSSLQMVGVAHCYGFQQDAWVGMCWPKSQQLYDSPLNPKP